LLGGWLRAVAVIVEWKGFVVLDVAGGEVSTKKKPGLNLEPFDLFQLNHNQ